MPADEHPMLVIADEENGHRYARLVDHKGLGENGDLEKTARARRPLAPIIELLRLAGSVLNFLAWGIVLVITCLIGVRGSPARGYFPPARVEGGWSKSGNSSNRRRRRRRRRPNGSKSKKHQKTTSFAEQV